MRGDIPHPSENTAWPAWFFPPETNPEDPASDGRVFTCAEDVPEGWAFDWRAHGVSLDREPPAAPVQRLSRLDLFRELKIRDIPCGATLGTAALQKLYDEALAAEALDESV